MDIIKLFSNGHTIQGDWEAILDISTNIAIKKIVEIGTGYGTSSILLSKGGAEVYTIDNYQIYNTINMYPFIRDFLEIYTNGKVKAIKANSYLESFVWEDNTIDLLYIDGGHRYIDVKADYTNWISKLKKQCVVLFHDMTPEYEGVWKFYNEDIKSEIKNNKLYELKLKNKNETKLKGFVKI